MDRRLTPLLVIAALLCSCSSGGSTDESTATDTGPVESPPPVPAQSPWPLFGVPPDRRNDFQAPTGITAGNVTTLARVSIGVPGTVDSSPISAGGRFVVTTSYGKTLALDRHGRILWTYTPPGIDGWQGSSQITNASPAADPDGEHVYAVSPDGVVHKLSLGGGGGGTTGGCRPRPPAPRPTRSRGRRSTPPDASCPRRRAATAATPRRTRVTSCRSTGGAGRSSTS